MEVGSSTLPGTTIQGGLAQLARAPALQAGGHRFESDILHIFEKRIGNANPGPTHGGPFSNPIFDILNKSETVEFATAVFLWRWLKQLKV